MLKKFIVFLVVALAIICVFGMPFLFMLARYVSVKFAVLEIVATALLGLVILSYLKSRYLPNVMAKLTAGESPAEVLLDAGLIVLAAILLILPGMVTDLAGLLLLIPPVRWLIVGLFKKRSSLGPAMPVTTRMWKMAARNWPTGPVRLRRALAYVNRADRDCRPCLRDGLHPPGRACRDRRIGDSAR